MMLLGIARLTAATLALGLCALTGAAAAAAPASTTDTLPVANGPAASKPLADVIGSSHVAQRYFFGRQDCLNEGAETLLKTGSRVIKVWFYNGKKEPPQVMYPYNYEWPEVKSLVEGAKVPAWSELFHRPFTTYILNVMAMDLDEYYWLKGITEAQQQEEERQFYELAKHFLTEYQNTGKTFIFAHHEGDWHLKPTAGPQFETPKEVFPNMVKWLAARQRGVTRAREEVGEHGVHVYHAAEVVNVVKSLKDGQDNMVNQVLPHVKLDLVSYSCYDATVYYDKNHPPEELKEALDFIAANAIDSEPFGDKNVYIGEYGLPENHTSAEKVLENTRNVVQAGLEWGCPWIVYWQVYCNEAMEGKVPPVKNNADMRGFWLVRPDGSHSPVYDYFVRLCQVPSAAAAK